MIIGISIPSLIALLGGLFTYGYINDVKNRQELVQTADDLKENSLEIRRNEKNFLHYKNNENYSSLKEAAVNISKLLTAIPSQHIEKIGLNDTSSLNIHLKNYSALTEKMNSAFQNEKSIEKRVKEEGRKLEKLVPNKKLAKEISTSFILRLRLLEKNYMFFHDRESYLELNRGLSQLSNVTPVCYECLPYVESMRILFTAYRDSDAAAVTLQNTGDDIEALLRDVALNERAKIDSFITSTQRLLLIGLLLLCVLGPLFVYKTASYIAAPIKRLAELTKNISGGDLSLRAPLKETGETYSLAVSFNTMLDNLQETQLSLKESIELLNEKQAQLVESEKRASMGFLVAGVAHEINNPLNNISLRADLIQSRVEKYPDEKLHSFVQDIVEQSARAHDIVNNLLDFARARKSSILEKQDIVSIVNDSIKLIESQLRISNIVLEKELPETPYYVNGNRSKLEQVLVSIINNAIQAMGDSGTLTVGIQTEDNEVLIKISDTGSGIKKENIKNIFEPFFTTKKPGEGTGLGLAVGYTLIKEHNGDIIAESTPGKGTTFTIKLPVWEEPVA